MQYWFVSDLHLNHFNIIRFCNRPFKTLDEMNSTLIRNWNSRVKPEDTIFHIGDFCFKNSLGGKPGEGTPIKAIEWEKKLNGKIIHVKGNHDKNNSTKTIISNLVIYYGGKRINLVHDPKWADINFDINFTGHVHEKWAFKRIRKGEGFTDCINVGVDVNHFMPMSFNELISKYKNWLRNGQKGVEDENK